MRLRAYPAVKALDGAGRLALLTAAGRHRAQEADHADHCRGDERDPVADAEG